MIDNRDNCIPTIRSVVRFKRDGNPRYTYRLYYTPTIKTDYGVDVNVSSDAYYYKRTTINYDRTTTAGAVIVRN